MCVCVCVCALQLHLHRSGSCGSRSTFVASKELVTLLRTCLFGEGATPEQGRSAQAWLNFLVLLARLASHAAETRAPCGGRALAVARKPKRTARVDEEFRRVELVKHAKL